MLKGLTSRVTDPNPTPQKSGSGSDEKQGQTGREHTICPGSSDPFYVVTYYIKWITTLFGHIVEKENAIEMCFIRIFVQNCISSKRLDIHFEFLKM